MQGLQPQALWEGNGLAMSGAQFVAASGDGGLSWSPSSSTQPRATCDATMASCGITLPAATARFNLWAWANGRAYWLDLTKWSAKGSCAIVDDGLGGLVLVRK